MRYQLDEEQFSGVKIGGALFFGINYIGINYINRFTKRQKLLKIIDLKKVII